MSVLLDDFTKLDSFLDGTSFHENLRIQYGSSGGVRLRDDDIRDICADKRVLHVGCCDHVPLIQAKLASGTWVHKIVTDASAFTLGVDNDADAVKAATEIAELNNMIVGDITAPTKIPEVASQKFDIALFGEVVEHISNPVTFLSAFRKNYSANFSKIVITVPNAFRAGNIKGVLSNVETLNSDHRFFFTPYTIAKVVVDAGYIPESVSMATFTRPGRIKSAILNRWPLLSEDIILTAKPVLPT